MSSIPNPYFWLQTFGLLALQMAVITGLAAGVQTWLKSAAARRAAWQGALLGAALLTANAFTGADRALAGWARSEPAARRMTVARGNLPPTLSAPDNAEFPVARSIRAPAVEAPASPAARWWPAWLWLAGALIVGGRALGSRLLLVWLTRRGGMKCGPETGERIATLAGGLGFRRPVRLIESAALVGPIAFGWWRPTIGLPKGFFADHSRAEQDTMLAHELAHLAARDPLWLALADALSAALWWHPAIWWLRRQFRAASETAADHASLLVQDGPVILADCLVALAARLPGRRATGWLGMAEFRSGLGRRVERLLKLRPEETGGFGKKAHWVAPVIVAFVVVGLAAAAWAFPNSRSEGPTLFALVQEAMHSEEPPISELRPKAVISATGIEHNSLAEFSADSPAAEPSGGTTQAITGGAAVTQSNRLASATLVQDARLLYEMGALEGAEGRLKRAAELDPDSTLARYYLQLVQAARATEATRRQPAAERLASSPTNRLESTRGRQQLMQALERIRFEEIGFARLPLADVLRTLGEQSRQRDPEQRGVNFLLVGELAPDTVAPAGEASQGLAKTTSNPASTNRVCINLQPPLKSATLAEVLGAVVKAADQPIKYAVQDFAVVVSPGGPTPAPLFSRAYKVDLNSLEAAFGKAPGAQPTNALTRVREGLLRQLATAGWTLDPAKGEALKLNEKLGLLDVRATLQDLDLVERTLENLNPPTPRTSSQTKREPEQEWLPPTKKPVVARTRAATNSEAGGQLFTRTYKVDLNQLARTVAGADGWHKTNLRPVYEALEKQFTAAGWNRATNETFYVNEHSGLLYARAALTNLDVIESILQVLNSVPPQVVVQAKFIEVSQDDVKVLGFDWYLGNVKLASTNSAMPGITSGLRGGAAGVFPGNGQAAAPGPRELRGDELDWMGRGATNAGNIRVSALLGSQMTGIFTEAQYRVVLKALEQRSGADVLSAPSVTTLSGRQAQIQVVDMKTVVTVTDPVAGTNAVTTAVIPCGPVLDIVPTVLADGATVQMNVKASVTEFLGYDPAPRGTAGGPQPRFRLRELKTIANVWDGQTLVLGGPIVESANSNTNAAGKVARKQLLVFVTPTIVDPAGNRVHAADEMPFSTNGVPPQPKPGK